MQRKIRLLTFAIATAFAPLAFAQDAAPASTVREAAQKAVVSNPDVQASWHAFRAAAEEQDVARGGYLPQIDLTVGAGREHQRDPGVADRHYTRRGATLSLNQMLYDGFATRNEVARLGYAKLTRYYEVLDASENAALEAVRAYEDVLRYRQLVLLAQDNYLQHREIHDQIARRAQAGVGRGVDLEQAAGRLALAESNLLTEASNLHDVSARYLRVVGELPPESLAATPPLREGIPPAVSEALKRAYAASPTFNAAIEAVRSAQAEVGVQRARFHPRLDLRARRDTGRDIDGISGRSDTGIVEVVLNYNLYNGGSDLAATRQFGERLNQAKDLRDKACRDLRQTLSIAYNDTRRLDDQLRFLERHQLAIGKAREAYRDQFDIGQRTLLDLLDTENEYFEARRAYINALHDRSIAHARTLAGMGELLKALEVSRADLPGATDVGQDRDGIDPDTACPPVAPAVPAFDKTAVIPGASR